MLGFFRKYQRYFYLLVTIVIVISFSFFGTYSTLGADSIREAVAFKAVDGTNVTRTELEEMAVFLGTDAVDKQLYGGAWGPNFLNNGVIQKDFLETGLAEMLIQAYMPEFKSDLDIRLRKERGFVPYIHPNGRFISAMGAWNYFAPDMMQELVTVQKATDASNPSVLHAKVRLYLLQRQFDPRMLGQVLSYQQNQYQQFVQPDPNLARTDLFLFGYHSLDDWFGQKFTRLISQFVINAAKIAEQRGYKVSYDEALADLLRSSEVSFRENMNNPAVGVKSSSDYFLEQLRRMGMDQVHAVNTWRNILLFKRLFHDLGNSVYVDPFLYGQFNQYALEMVEGTVYRLPKDLQLADFPTLQNFEAYLNSVSKRGTDEKSTLDLPQTFMSVEEVAKRTPELVQQTYKVEVASVDRKSLEARVGIKETWDWETKDQNWTSIKGLYPELGQKPANTKEERLAALDTLNSVSRAKVDQFARSSIVDEHPEWIKEALDKSEIQASTVGLRAKGGKFPFSGIEDRAGFIKLLDQAPINAQDDKLAAYKAGSQGYFRVKVLEKSPGKEVLTFAEANSDGTLNEIVDGQLDVAYVKVRSQNPEKFQNPDKSWKPLSEVKNLVAEVELAKLLKAIRADYAANIGSDEKADADKLTTDKLATLRFYKYMRESKNAMEKDPSKADVIVRKASQVGDENKRAPLADQWKLAREEETQVTRGSEDDALNLDELLKLQQKGWSSVYAPVNGDVNFFYAVKRGVKEDPEALAEQINGARWLLSNDAQHTLMYQLLKVIGEKKAITFDYLTPNEPTMEQEQA